VALTRRRVAADVVVANCDTLTAALELGDACMLNFANAEIPGGRYRHNARAQEEDLCRLLPQLYDSLVGARYPIAPGSALVSRRLAAVRQPGTYALCDRLGEVTIVTAAMPCGIADHRPKGGWANSAWAFEVTPRLRAVLHAARSTGHANVVLGAFGSGAFGNPPAAVAAIFRDELASPAFRGAFATVAFAILDPLGQGNLRPFVAISDTLPTPVATSQAPAAPPPPAAPAEAPPAADTSQARDMEPSPRTTQT
jgi:hypothetical protein